VRRFRETGSVAAKPMAGDHRLVRTDGRDWRLKREAGELDLTIEELRDKLKARGVIVGGSSSRSSCSTVTRPNDRLARSPDPSL
jgi:hypothetical protein